MALTIRFTSTCWSSVLFIRMSRDARVLPFDCDRRLIERMLDERQHVGDDIRHVILFRESSVFLRLSELKQPGYNFADAVQLLVYKPKFRLCRFRLAAHQVANQLEISLHDRDRIVD